MAVTFIYATKWAISQLFLMRYPDNMIWDYPGWYSLTVSYGAANDLHFSVQVALLVAIAWEYYTMRWFKLTGLTFIALFSQMFLLLALRGAYSIDVFGGLVFGHYGWTWAYHYSYLIDCNVFGLTFQERFPHYQTECSNCKHPVNRWATNSATEVKDAVD